MCLAFSGQISINIYASCKLNSPVLFIDVRRTVSTIGQDIFKAFFGVRSFTVSFFIGRGKLGSFKIGCQGVQVVSSNISATRKCLLGSTFPELFEKLETFTLGVNKNTI